jgi:hypothetical protein
MLERLNPLRYTLLQGLRMKIKTAELSGKALCYSVCMIEMPHLVWGETIGIHYASDQIVVPELPSPACYTPFLGWEEVGPIIERESIDIIRDPNGTAGWGARTYRDRKALWSYGPTPIIAAMRCYVASKLGDEVEIPEDLK